MKIVAVIPARFASTRFPGKALAPIAGRPMIQHVWERTNMAQRVNQVIVATDDERIARVCREAGMDVAMTSTSHLTGTDRMVEVSRTVSADVFVNVQGDEPLIDPASIDTCVDALVANLPRGIDVSTVFIEGATPEQEASTSTVCLVPTLDGCVLALSRLAIPCAFRDSFVRNVHAGLYAFTPDALARFASRAPGPVERAESIELYRYLEYGDRIACRAIPPGSIGVDHPEDVARVEAILASRA